MWMCYINGAQRCRDTYEWFLCVWLCLVRGMRSIIPLMSNEAYFPLSSHPLVCNVVKSFFEALYHHQHDHINIYKINTFWYGIYANNNQKPNNLPLWQIPCQNAYTNTKTITKKIWSQWVQWFTLLDKISNNKSWTSSWSSLEITYKIAWKHKDIQETTHIQETTNMAKDIYWQEK